MKVVHVGNFPPRLCGIATFTENLVRAIQGRNETIVQQVIAVDETDNQYTYPETVYKKIRKNSISDYRKAAVEIGREGVDVVMLQHEFGIFGGESGIFITDFIDALNKPLIVTLHTVLEEPTSVQKRIVECLAKKACQLVVMSNKAKELLIENYAIPGFKITKIDHGAPVFELPAKKLLKEKFGFTDKRLIVSFGLLGRGKGVATVIKALPALIKQFPDLHYLYLGRTHPNVLKSEGEAYRQSLLQLASDLGVRENISFVNEFIDEKTLFQYLKIADLYITPYPNRAQITSGTLSYAVSMGTPVVSTPYWHAVELLASGNGRFFDFNDHQELGSILLELFASEDQLLNMRIAAEAVGKNLAWPQKGAEYIKLAERVHRDRRSVNTNRFQRHVEMPEVNWKHILQLTDSTGILQHAKFSIPNFHEGYCVDDNARALILMSLCARYGHYQIASRLAPTYIAFLFYAQKQNGWFHNFAGYNRQFLDTVGSDDAQGRAIWAMGNFLLHPVSTDLAHLVKEMFERSLSICNSLKSPRAVAFSLVGLCLFYKKYPENRKVKYLINKLGMFLSSCYQKTADNEWRWYEEGLTYANAILPLGLLMAAKATYNSDWFGIVDESLQFLEEHTFMPNYFQPVGSEKFMIRGSSPCYFDQQPIEAMLALLLYKELYSITGDNNHYERAQQCYSWFLGVNALRVPLYNAANGGCYDGLHINGANLNQGAESTLAYWLSHFSWKELKAERLKEISAHHLPAELKSSQIKSLTIVRENESHEKVVS